MNQPRQCNRSRGRRSGVSTVETAIVLSVVFLLLFVILDLGVATVRYNILAAASRRLAREAIVHGERSPPERTKWGPTPFNGNAGDGSAIALATSPWLPTMRPQDVAIRVTWPDTTNEEGDRVQVRLSYVHRRVVPFGSIATVNLQANCTMRIVY